MAEVIHAPVVVVGGGVVGCAAAYYLSRAGMPVVLLEQRRVAWAASGRNAGAIRAHGRHHLEFPLAMASRDLWQAFAQESPLNFFWRQDGDLIVACSPEEEARLERAAAAYNRLGLAVGLVRGAELRALMPAVGPLVRCGAYCPSDALAYPILATRALARAAEQHGARILTRTAATGILTRGGRAAGVAAGDLEVRADWVVNAAGPWAPAVGAMAGVRIPVVARRSQIMVTERQPPTLKPFVSGNGIYCRQSPYGNLLIGGGGPWEAVGFETSATAGTVHRLASQFLQVFPGLRGVGIIRAWAGTVEITPDHLPIIGPVQALPGLLVAAGFSGNGFAMGPVAGKMIADLITRGGTDWDLAPFRAERFAPGLDWPAVYRQRGAGTQEPV